MLDAKTHRDVGLAAVGESPTSKASRQQSTVGTETIVCHAHSGWMTDSIHS